MLSVVPMFRDPQRNILPFTQRQDPSLRRACVQDDSRDSYLATTNCLLRLTPLTVKV